MELYERRIRIPRVPGWTTPTGLILRAGTGVLIFLVLHRLEFRVYTGVLSGTAVSGRPAAYPDMLRMVAYVLAYLFAVVVAPILAIAAGLLYVCRRRGWLPRRGSPAWRPVWQKYKRLPP